MENRHIGQIDWLPWQLRYLLQYRWHHRFEPSPSASSRRCLGQVWAVWCPSRSSNRWWHVKRSCRIHRTDSRSLQGSFLWPHLRTLLWPLLSSNLINEIINNKSKFGRNEKTISRINTDRTSEIFHENFCLFNFRRVHLTANHRAEGHFVAKLLSNS